MNKILKLSFAALLMIVSVIAINSCKKNFDNPPAYVDPNLVANTSIATLKAMHASGGYEAITTDIIISGTVIADDKSGNLYKELYIQDATGGIAIEMDGTNLYTQYPVGRKVFIKAKGLYLSDYAGMIQIGVLDKSIPNNPSLAGIPYTLFDTYIARGTYNNPVVPTVVTVAQLTTNMQDPLLGTLVQLNGFEFSSGDVTGNFADTSSAKNSFDLYINDCSSNSIDVRTSGYANFAGQHPPSGNGSIVALYTKYNSTKQLILRDPSDISFTGPRCSVFEESFNAIGANNGTLTVPGWKNIGETGGVLYQNAIFGSVKCGKITAFSTGAAAVTSWFISPSIAITGATAPKLNFKLAAGYAVGATVLQVLVSTNYNGSNTPSSSTWTQVFTQTALTPTSGYGTLASVGNIDLSAYNGQTVYIAFKYTGGDPTKTTTYEFDDFKILRQ